MIRGMALGAAGWWRRTRRATSTWWSPSAASRRRTSLRSRWRLLALRGSHTKTSAAACVPSIAVSSSEGPSVVLFSVQGSAVRGVVGLGASLIILISKASICQGLDAGRFFAMADMTMLLLSCLLKGHRLSARAQERAMTIC